MNSSDGMLIVNVSAIQAVAIAAVTIISELGCAKSSVFRKVLRAESGRGGYVGCTGTFLPGIFPFHESQL